MGKDGMRAQASTRLGLALAGEGEAERGLGTHGLVVSADAGRLQDHPGLSVGLTSQPVSRME